jgi:hypothetical protein
LHRSFFLIHFSYAIFYSDIEESYKREEEGRREGRKGY